MTHALQEDLALALRLADAADAVALPRFRASDLRIETKPDRTPVTDADRAVEDAIRQLLASERPQDAFLGEETGATDGTGPDAPGRQWIVDPIDGTANFLRGFPAWGTLIALVIDGRVDAGVISMPALGRRWWAGRGLGARAIDRTRDVAPRSIRVSDVSSLSDAAIAVPRLDDWQAEGRLEPAFAAIRTAWRTFGATDAWSYGLLAEGVVDVAMEPSLKPWDIAPAIVIVEEAGGRIADLEGTASPWLRAPIATNGRLHDEVVALFH